MKEMTFSLEIHASKETVWNTLWQDETLREWMGVIDPGTYMVGDLKEGNEIQYISAENGYGVTSLVETLVKYEFVLFTHTADTQDTGKRERAKEWTGGKESYLLVEKDGITTLKAVYDVPLKMVEYFEVAYPKALGKVKELAEK
ncbi:MAG: hypothetical protein ABIP50_02175 [Candidatus Saccharimonadales bacterium]